VLIVHLFLTDDNRNSIRSKKTAAAAAAAATTATAQTAI
jgi:hypothetical protein